MNLEVERIALHAQRLNLHTVADVAPLLAEEAAKNNQSYTQFLERVLRASAAGREEKAPLVLSASPLPAGLVRLPSSPTAIPAHRWSLPRGDVLAQSVYPPGQGRRR